MSFLRNLPTMGSTFLCLGVCLGMPSLRIFPISRPSSHLEIWLLIGFVLFSIQVTQGSTLLSNNAVQSVHCYAAVPLYERAYHVTGELHHCKHCTVLFGSFMMIPSMNQSIPLWMAPLRNSATRISKPYKHSLNACKIGTKSSSSQPRADFADS